MKLMNLWRRRNELKRFQGLLEFYFSKKPFGTKESLNEIRGEVARMMEAKDLPAMLAVAHPNSSSERHVFRSKVVPSYQRLSSADQEYLVNHKDRILRNILDSVERKANRRFVAIKNTGIDFEAAQRLNELWSRLLVEEINLPKDIWQRINSVDWKQAGFSLDKAYICALFARLAYLHVPEWELQDTERIKIVPCMAYQEIVRSRDIINIGEVLRRADMAEFFIIERRFAIIIGVRATNVVIVAIRETKYLYDWVINLNSIRQPLAGTDDGIYFHRGFFTAIAACFGPLELELHKYDGQHAVPIYVVGHSLGGAMAAIMHAVFDNWPLAKAPPITTDFAYTFGMPRYGNFTAMCLLRQPYHIYNEADIVPDVPPKWLGYANCFTEFRANGVEIEKIRFRQNVTFAHWLLRLFTGSGVANHNIELYVDMVRENLRS
jgi:lipase (class 3)